MTIRNKKKLDPAHKAQQVLQGSRPVFSIPEQLIVIYNELGGYSTFFALIIFIAAVIRIWHAFAISSQPILNNLILDSKWYDEWAVRIAKGDWLGGNKPFYMDPLYPYLLAVLYGIFGHNLVIVRLFQAAFGIAVCIQVACMGHRIGGRSVGLLTALLATLYQPLVFEGGEVEKTAVGMFLITASLYCAMRTSTASRFSAGALLALASLCRSNLLILGPLGALYFLLNSEDDIISRGNDPRGWLHAHVTGRPARDAIAFILGFILMLSPVLARNHYVSGEWILTTSQMGTNFYHGNNPSNSSGSYTILPFVRPTPEYEEYDFHAKAKELTGKDLSAKEVSSFWFKKTLEHLWNDPVFAVKVFIRKIIFFWADLENSDGWSMYFIKRYSPALCLSLFTFGWIFPFSLIGAVVSFRLGREARLLMGFALIYFVSVIMFFTLSRYRIYVVPPLLIFASLGIKWMWNRLQERNWRKFVPGSLVILATAVFSFSADTISGVTIADASFGNMAKLYIVNGDYASAEALLQEALQKEPGSAPTLLSMGIVRSRRGDLQGAVTYYLRCIDADQEYPDVWNNLGAVYEKSGKYHEARQCYEKQLKITPGHQQAMLNLQRLLKVKARKAN